MNPDTSHWTALFSRGPTAPGRQRFKVIRRRGEDFLALPAAPRAAAAALGLYPAQSAKARMTKASLRACLHLGVAPGSRNVAVPIHPDQPFVTFLARLVQTRELPLTGVLAGNPATAGRRYVVLVFDEDKEPRYVIKAGLSTEAHGLVRREASLLESIGAKFPGVPQMCAQLSDPHVCAFALLYVEGIEPRNAPPGRLGQFLGTWINQQASCSVGEIANWRALEKACAEIAAFQDLRAKLKDNPIHPALFHGDFAPWNLKEDSEGQWTVLDWERGEVSGPPAWDWFHFLTQPLLLVRKMAPQSVAQRVDQLLDSPDFLSYAALSKVQPFRRQWYLAYLWHHIEVVRPSEGRESSQQLLQLLSQQWGLN